MKNKITVTDKYGTYIIVLNEKGTAVYMELPDSPDILCKSWQGNKINLAFNYISKNVFI